jgi:hypothetical protein
LENIAQDGVEVEKKTREEKAPKNNNKIIK